MLYLAMNRVRIAGGFCIDRKSILKTDIYI